MGQKFIIILFSSVTVFVITFYIISHEWLLNHLFPLTSCNKDENCVRFCCPYEHLCHDDVYLRNVTLSFFDNVDESFKIIKGLPCGDLHESENGTFEKNGFVHENPSHVFTWNQYCFLVDETNANLSQILTCPPLDLVESAKTIFPYLMLSSVPFLIATLAVYGFLKELRTTPGKCVMCYVFSLILMYSSLSAVHLYNYALFESHTKTCKSLGYMILMSILMSFLWLNVMCYDTFVSIRSFKPPYDSMKKFLFYCLYAFGLPFILISSNALLNEFEIIPYGWRTNIGNFSCLVGSPIIDPTDEEMEYSNRAQSLYMYGPIIVILIANFGFYSLTAYTIYNVQKNVQKFSKGERSKHARKETARFALYVRFFVMMGLPWVIEVCSWLFGDTFFLYLASIINCLQGFIILIMFVLHKKVLNLILKKIRPVENINQTKFTRTNLTRCSSRMRRQFNVRLSDTSNASNQLMNEQTKV